MRPQGPATIPQTESDWQYPLTRDGVGTLILSGAKNLGGLNLTSGKAKLANGGKRVIVSQGLSINPATAVLDLADIRGRRAHIGLARGNRYVSCLEHCGGGRTAPRRRSLGRWWRREPALAACTRDSSEVGVRTWGACGSAATSLPRGYPFLMLARAPSRILLVDPHQAAVEAPAAAADDGRVSAYHRADVRKKVHRCNGTMQESLAWPPFQAYRSVAGRS